MKPFLRPAVHRRCENRIKTLRWSSKLSGLLAFLLTCFFFLNGNLSLREAVVDEVTTDEPEFFTFAIFPSCIQCSMPFAIVLCRELSRHLSVVEMTVYDDGKLLRFSHAQRKDDD